MQPLTRALLALAALTTGLGFAAVHGSPDRARTDIISGGATDVGPALLVGRRAEAARALDVTPLAGARNRR